MQNNNPLWTPTLPFQKDSNLSSFIHWLRQEKNLNFQDYQALWEWSTENIDAFWEACLSYFQVAYSGEFKEVHSDVPMPGTRWFEGIELNYSEHIFRNASTEHPAMVFKSEGGSLREISWREMRGATAKLAQYLKSKGVGMGDCVVGYLPAIPEASISFLAANSLGAVWSSSSPDFGLQSVIDRFQQISPKILICADGYRYGGKEFDRKAVTKELVAAIPSLEEVIMISCLGEDRDIPDNYTPWSAIQQTDEKALSFTRVPFSHPIWVLYSSGTTGLPKALTHGHGGMLLEHFKYLSFHNNVKPGDRCFWYTTTGWMMWNYIQASWLCGGTVVLYDGSPAYPDLNALWAFAEEAGIQHFGTSAGFVTANMKAGIQPGRDFDLSAMISLASTGSPLPPEGFDWLYASISKDLWVTSISGGSDVCSAFVGGNPLWPVHRGEIQCRALGCKLEAFNEEGKAVIGQVGEMVITAPMPCMPIYLWNDPGFERYEESYFGMFPKIWRHGDWTEITDRKGVIIYGRSDSTLNRGGVRIGTSEIYRAVDEIREVQDSLVVAVEWENGEFYMPLFVMMKGGRELTDELKDRIRKTIRSAYSPRHVPDEIILAPDIPYTISGKKVETPIKKILSGKSTEGSLNRDALRNPGSLDFYIEFAKERKK